MNPIQSLYYVSPACLFCLSIPFGEDLFYCCCVCVPAIPDVSQPASAAFSSGQKQWQGLSEPYDLACLQSPAHQCCMDCLNHMCQHGSPEMHVGILRGSVELLLTRPWCTGAVLVELGPLQAATNLTFTPSVFLANALAALSLNLVGVPSTVLRRVHLHPSHRLEA